MNSAHGYTEGSEVESHKDFNDVIKDFLDQEDDTYMDEWYGTQRSICEEGAERLVKYLNDNNIELIVKENKEV